MALVAAAGLLAGACGGGSDKKESSSGGTKADRTAMETPAGPKLEVAAKEFSFAPNTVTLKAGQAATISLKNTGSIEHDLSVSDAGFKLTVPAGQTADKALTIAKPGTYEFHCSVSGHQDAGMKGTITVE